MVRDKEEAVLSLGFIYSFLDQQLKTSIHVAQLEKGREILGRNLLLKSLKTYSSAILVLPAKSSGPRKMNKTAGHCPGEDTWCGKKTMWQSFQDTLQFYSIANIRKNS